MDFKNKVLQLSEHMFPSPYGDVVHMNRLCRAFCHNGENIFLPNRIGINATIRSVNIRLISNPNLINLYNRGCLTGFEPNFIV